MPVTHRVHSVAPRYHVTSADPLSLLGIGQSEAMGKPLTPESASSLFPAILKAGASWSEPLMLQCRAILASLRHGLARKKLNYDRPLMHGHL